MTVRLASLAFCAAVASCTGQVSGAPPRGALPDAGLDQGPPDASPDAGSVDAGTPDAAVSSDAGGIPPMSLDGSLYVVEFNNDAGSANPNAYTQMFWQSEYATIDGTLIEWGTGDHGTLSDNGVREFDPLTGAQVYVYPNNSGTMDVQQYDNLAYWYVPQLDSLVIPARGQYARNTGRWVRGEAMFFPSGPTVVGSGANDLIRPIGSTDAEQVRSSYNAHQAWSWTHNAGVLIGGGNGGDNAARPWVWFTVPSGPFGGPQPYVMIRRDLPAQVEGAAPNKIGGRDGTTFLGDFVYWVGGTESLSPVATPHFFRMNIVPHLTSTSAPLAIERLADAPAAFRFGLLRADPFLNALLCVTDKGVFAYDPQNDTWSVVTPQRYLDDYAPAPTMGLLPYGPLGDFIDQRAGVTLRRFYWRPGMNHGWEFDYGGMNTERMHRRFRSIKLGRR